MLHLNELRHHEAPYLIISLLFIVITLGGEEFSRLPSCPVESLHHSLIDWDLLAR